MTFIFFYISLEFIPGGQIPNIPAFAQEKAWCQTGD